MLLAHGPRRGTEQIIQRCWEFECVDIQAPADVSGEFTVERAWFGHPTREELRADVTAQARKAVRPPGGAAEPSGGLPALSMAADPRLLGDPAPGCLKQLHVECAFRWLDASAQRALDALAVLARSPLAPAEEPEDGHRLTRFEEEWGGSSPSMAARGGSMISTEALLLEGHRFGRLALDGLLYVRDCRAREAAAIEASRPLGLPLAVLAAAVAQAIVRHYRLAPPEACGADGASLQCGGAGRPGVRRLAESLSRSSRDAAGCAFGALFADLLTAAHGEWMRRRHDDDGMEEVVRWIGQVAICDATQARWTSEAAAQSDVVFGPSQGAPQDGCFPLAASEIAGVAVRMAYCPICMRPLQQFPHEIGALADAQGCRIEAALYHKHCVVSGVSPLLTFAGSPGSRAHAELRAAPLLLRCEAHRAACGWWPMPRPSAPSAWAKFVAAGAPGRIGGRAPAAASVPCAAVAAALAAVLPSHAGHLERLLLATFATDGGAVPVRSLEDVARWAFERQAELAEASGWGPPELQDLTVPEDPARWAAWFRGWDVDRQGWLQRDALGLALVAAAREAVDRRGTAAAVAALPLVVAALVSLAWCGHEAGSALFGRVSLDSFIGEMAPQASAHIQVLLDASDDCMPNTPLRRAASPAPLCAEDGLRRTMGSPRRHTAEAAAGGAGDAPESSLLTVAFESLAAARRTAQLPVDLPVGDLRHAVSLFMADSLGFAAGGPAEAMLLCLSGRRLLDPSATLQAVGVRQDSTILALSRQGGTASMEKLEAPASAETAKGGGPLALFWVLALAVLAVARSLHPT